MDISPTDRGPAIKGNSAKKGPGCLFYGCLTVIVLVLVIIAAGSWFLRRLTEVAVDYTVATPKEIRVSPLEPKEFAHLETRWEQFEEALAGKGAVQLVLSEREINGFIAEEPSLEFLRGRLQVAIQNSQLGGDICIPIKGLSFPFRKLNDRYVCGSAEFSLSFQDETFEVFLKAFELRGKDLPRQVVEHLKSINLADEFLSDAEKNDHFKYLESIRVVGDKLILRTKAH